MFSHIQLGARDLPRLAAFYDHVLEPIGLVRLESVSDGGPPDIVWHRPGTRWPLFILQYPWNGLPATWGNGSQVSFSAPSREAVDLAWRRVVDQGGLSEGVPDLRPNYGPDFYAAYGRDPEGNKLCFAHAERLEAQLSGGELMSQSV
ncbi:catechol 2,3-dioxygenase-like lactoylglutathione lyase family enzyme [Kushneria sinocarnis]|uniref:Catechol 2,3-dioxygenase-like lactoylglutathione lyase family enzyme n=1 Tax=Kushneria sinocarnis TaxID=595502 RepID=A0A420WTK7_9GAMM|nr:VOC family protein [Kushneria sinocarnis]RKQ96868.1 catechol 2,3-dioxygenase-like lactoylglutathione lyase family enzyme [Kushneria sinocarnis]